MGVSLVHSCLAFILALQALNDYESGLGAIIAYIIAFIFATVGAPILIISGLITKLSYSWIITIAFGIVYILSFIPILIARAEDINWFIAIIPALVCIIGGISIKLIAVKYRARV